MALSKGNPCEKKAISTSTIGHSSIGASRITSSSNKSVCMCMYFSSLSRISCIGLEFDFFFMAHIPNTIFRFSSSYKIKNIIIQCIRTKWQHSEECMCHLRNIAMRESQGFFKSIFGAEFRPHSQCKNDQYFPPNGWKFPIWNFCPSWNLAVQILALRV